MHFNIKNSSNVFFRTFGCSGYNLDIKENFNFWKRVFLNFKYSLLAIIIAILFYAFNVFIANYKTLISFSSYLGFFGTIKFFFILMLGFKNLIIFSSFISLILISLLFGIFFSLIFYRIINLKKFDKKHGFISGLGILLGAFAPGCAACGIGLASILGLSGAFLTILPFKGLELSILAVILLTIAIFKTSKDSCKLMITKNERRLI